MGAIGSHWESFEAWEFFPNFSSTDLGLGIGELSRFARPTRGECWVREHPRLAGVARRRGVDQGCQFTTSIKHKLVVICVRIDSPLEALCAAGRVLEGAWLARVALAGDR